MWYMENNYITSDAAMTQIVNLFELLTDALMAMWAVSIFRFFIAVTFMAVGYAIFRAIYSTAQKGIR